MPGPRDDTVPAVRVDPVTRPGDVWQIGPHRLICGDCRDVGTVNKVVGTAQAAVVIRVVRPAEVDGQRASALRFGDKRVQALFTGLVVFSLQLRGFTNAEMRALLAQLLGFDPADYPAGKLTYDLRRLRLHGIIERIPHSHRYRLTADGLRIALFFSRTYARLLRPKLAEIMSAAPPIPSTLRRAFDRLESEIGACCNKERVAA